MKIKKYIALIITILFSLGISVAHGDSSTCKIKINDVKQGSAYKIEYKFNITKDDKAQRKHFDLKDNNYNCTLVFFSMSSGTMLSCKYKDDIGQTFFQSDRSTLIEKPINNLTFRHDESFITIETKCK